jgi:hypothetical protein
MPTSRTRFRPLPSLLLLLFLLSPVHGQTNSLLFVTLNCYWFGTEFPKYDQPRNEREYDQKAGHLIGLLPAEAPLFIGLQEIGNLDDVNRLAHSARMRWKRNYQPLFVQGKDTATKQDVAALLRVRRVIDGEGIGLNEGDRFGGMCEYG